MPTYMLAGGRCSSPHSVCLYLRHPDHASGTQHRKQSSTSPESGPPWQSRTRTTGCCRCHTSLVTFHSIPFHSIPFHSIPFHSIPFHSIPFHSIPFLPFIPFPYSIPSMGLIKRQGLPQFGCACCPNLSHTLPGSYMQGSSPIQPLPQQLFAYRSVAEGENFEPGHKKISLEQLTSPSRWIAKVGPVRLWRFRIPGLGQ